MSCHVLNGDALAEKFPSTELPGALLVCRECLIEGPLDGDCPTTFWETRARYLSKMYQESPERYHAEVARPLSALCQLPADAEVNLWFEHDLFCQTNLWLTFSLLAANPQPLHVHLVYPYLDHPDRLWQGFGGLDRGGLMRSFEGRRHLSPADLKFGANLWRAYKTQDLKRLAELSATSSPAFPYLADVVQAHLDRFGGGVRPGRPERVLAELIADHGADFSNVFSAFCRREGIYGFGDVQVRRMFDQICNAN